MPKDKYTSLWISHSRLNDFLHCPRLYYLKNEYKDPKNNRKIQEVAPPLALGTAVHEVLESLSLLPTKTRFVENLLPKFEIAWSKVSGKKGGFRDIETEFGYKQRGLAMLKRVNDHPGPLASLSVKINMDLPYYWLDEEENIILCGKIDWLEYLSDSDSVHIIDFKTSKTEEDPDSLQLPIYHLLASNCQKREVKQASYWYLENSDELTSKPLPNSKLAQDKILSIAKQIKLAKKLNRFKCPTSGCRYCQPYEAIVSGEAEYVGIGEFGQDLYLLDKTQNDDREGSIL